MTSESMKPKNLNLAPAMVPRFALAFAVLYVFAYGLFHLFGLRDSYVRPLIPVAVAMVGTFIAFRRQR